MVELADSKKHKVIWAIIHIYQSENARAAASRPYVGDMFITSMFDICHHLLISKQHTLILANNKPTEGASFSLINRLLRFAWQLIWLLLFRPTPPQLHFWRCWLLRCFGAQIDTDCHVYSDARIWAPWNLHLGAKACIGRGVICYSMAPIYIGERVVISQGVHLCTGSHDYTSISFKLIAKPINIGDDAWICAESFVGPGVQIGEGAVIGARSVVVHSQPAWMVCAGNPARPLKQRHHPHSIHKAHLE